MFQLNIPTATPEQIKEMRTAIDNFSQLLDTPPSKDILEKTPDGKALSLPISHVESRLDSLFFGQWGTEDFKWQVCQNEIIGKITIWVIHPVTFLKITREGAASVQITVDALDADVKKGMTRKSINSYALDVANKKPNALHLLAGKLKAECFKNAAQSLGKAFGKDLNRNAKAEFKRMTKKEAVQAPKELPMPTESELNLCLEICEGDKIPIELRNEFILKSGSGQISTDLLKKVLSYGS